MVNTWDINVRNSLFDTVDDWLLQHSQSLNGFNPYHGWIELAEGCAEDFRHIRKEITLFVSLKVKHGKQIILLSCSLFLKMTSCGFYKPEDTSFVRFWRICPIWAQFSAKIWQTQSSWDLVYIKNELSTSWNPRCYKSILPPPAYWKRLDYAFHSFKKKLCCSFSQVHNI